MKSSHLLQARLSFYVNAIAVELHVACDLKVILFLTNKGVVRVGEVEAFIGIDSKVRNWSVNEFIENVVQEFRKIPYNS